MKGKFGKIYINANIGYERTWDIIEKLKFVPTKVEHLLHTNQLEMVGISPLFDVLKEGSMIPEYDLLKDSYGNLCIKKIQTFDKGKEKEMKNIYLTGWKPKETDIKSLKFRIKNGDLGKDELIKSS